MGLLAVRMASFGLTRMSHQDNTYRRLSSSFFMMQSVPDLLHCVHSVLPSGTTQRILLSRQEAQAIEARCRTCPLLDSRELWPKIEQWSWPEESLAPSEGNLGCLVASSMVVVES